MKEYFAYDPDEYYESLQMGLPVLYYSGRENPPHPEIWVNYFLRMVELYSKKVCELSKGVQADDLDGGLPYLNAKEFREIDLVLDTICLLEHSVELYVFDGNGYLHPRHMGLATHAGILLGVPTIGVAKSYYKVENIDYIEPGNQAFAYEDIVIRDEVYGRVLRTHENVRPIFLSVGNLIDIETAMEVTKHFVTKESHIPMPTRYADIMTHKMRKEYQKIIEE